MKSSQELENDFIASPQVAEILNEFEPGQRQYVEMIARFGYRTGEPAGFMVGYRLAQSQHVDLASPREVA